MIKVVTVCEQGNSRSVAAAYFLKSKGGFEAIAMGINNLEYNTYEMLFHWADKIILMDERYLDKIPPQFRAKLVVWNVGPDVYFNGWQGDILEQIEKYYGEGL